MSSQNLTIRDIPRIERPREKLLKYGVGCLSAAELLAILLGTGRKGESVLVVARKLLKAVPFEKFSLHDIFSHNGPARTATSFSPR